ncbi:MAG TPA: glucose 1-dehydrogenase [Caldimonas sp.]|jgi:gluconate 5-dehydrogenase
MTAATGNAAATAVGPSFDLAGKTALVTGAGSGLGFAIARGLAAAGARVVLNGRTYAKLEAAATALRSDGLGAEIAAFDVADPDAVRAGVAAVQERVAPIDILVNNAGIQHRAPIVDFADADWRRLMATNLDAPFYMARAVIPAMQARRAGKIINIGSLMSSLARPTTVPYQVSKGGIAMLTRGLAVELAPHDIQVNAIAPGFFRTEMNAALTANVEFTAWVERRTPAGRWAEPYEIAGAAVFLASPAARYVTGQILYVDGGFTAGM